MATKLFSGSVAITSIPNGVPGPDRFPPSERPEHLPRGFEWLPDAFKRDVEPHGPDAREQVRQALAEGDVQAILRTPIGKRHEIDPRMWNKEPLAKKVYPRFGDGWMRMRLKPDGGPFESGWICVPEGSFRKIFDEGEAALERRRTAAAKNLTPKAPRKRDVEADAKLKNRINKVLAKARTKWPNPKKRPEIDVMAKELARLYSKELGYGSETIRKILTGAYSASVRLKISGL